MRKWLSILIVAGLAGLSIGEPSRVHESMIDTRATGQWNSFRPTTNTLQGVLTWLDYHLYDYLQGIIGPQGSNGPAGANGVDGYTPVFGVDYFNGTDGIDGTNQDLDWWLNKTSILDHTGQNHGVSPLGGFYGGVDAAVHSSGSVWDPVLEEFVPAVGGHGAAVGGGAESTDGGIAGGYHAWSQGGGAAAGYGAEEAYGGGAVGYEAFTWSGGAVGNGASSYAGFSGGSGAVSTANSAIQLGEGLNTSERTLQIYTYQLLGSNGVVPADRVPYLLTNIVVSGHTGSVADAMASIDLGEITNVNLSGSLGSVTGGVAFVSLNSSDTALGLLNTGARVFVSNLVWYATDTFTNDQFVYVTATGGTAYAGPALGTRLQWDASDPSIWTIGYWAYTNGSLFCSVRTNEWAWNYSVFPQHLGTNPLPVTLYEQGVEATESWFVLDWAPQVSGVFQVKAAISNDAPADGGQYVRKDLDWAALLEYDPNWAGVSGSVMQTVTDWNADSNTVIQGAILGASSLQPNAVDGTDPLGNVFANGQLTTLGSDTPWTGLGYITAGDVAANEADGIFGTWLAGVPNISTFYNDSGYLTAGDVAANEADGLSWHKTDTAVDFGGASTVGAGSFNLSVGANTLGASTVGVGEGLVGGSYSFLFGNADGVVFTAGDNSGIAGRNIRVANGSYAFGKVHWLGSDSVAFGYNCGNSLDGPDGCFFFNPDSAFTGYQSGVENNTARFNVLKFILDGGDFYGRATGLYSFPSIFQLVGGGEFDTAIAVTNDGTILRWSGGEIDSAAIVTNGGTASLSGLTLVDDYQPTLGLANATNFPPTLLFKDQDGAETNVQLSAIVTNNGRAFLMDVTVLNDGVSAFYGNAAGLTNFPASITFKNGNGDILTFVPETTITSNILSGGAAVFVPPTSAAGLPVGAIWNNGGTITVVTE